MSKTDLIRSVTYLLAIDGVITTQETRFLEDLRRRLDVPEEVVTSEIERIRQGKGKMYLPSDAAEIKRLLGFLIQAAVADGIVVFKEQHLIQKVASKIGIPPKEVQQMIARKLKQCPSHRRDQRSAEERLPNMLRDITSSPEEAEKTPQQSFHDLMSTLQGSQTMVCPKCGFAQDEADVCAQCGVNIDWYDDGQAARTVLNDSGKGMICPECGQVQKKSRRCAQCGTYIENYANTKKPPPPRKYPTPEHVAKRVRQNRRLALVIPVLCVLVALAGFFIYKTQETRQPQTMTLFNNTFLVTKPAGWQIESTLFNDTHILFVKPAEECYWAVLTEGRFRAAYRKSSQPELSAYSSLSGKAEKKPLHDAEIVSGPVDISMNGLRGVQYNITGQVEQKPLNVLYTIFESDTYFYHILAQAPSATFELQRITFDEMLHSFRRVE